MINNDITKEYQQQLLDNNKILLAEIDILNDKYTKSEELNNEYKTFKDSSVECLQQLSDKNKILQVEIDIINDKHLKLKEDYDNIISNFNKLKIDFNNKNIYYNSLLVRQSLDISKYKDKYDTLKMKSHNTIKILTNSNNEKTDTINKLIIERGEINC
jgi:hypothetical protein